MLLIIRFFGLVKAWGLLTWHIIFGDTNGGKRWTLGVHLYAEENMPNLASNHESYPHY